jgi:hypothetical protein
MLVGQLGAGLVGGGCGVWAGTGGLAGDFGSGPLRRIFSNDPAPAFLDEAGCECAGTRLKSEFTCKGARALALSCALDAWLTSVASLLLLLEHALHVPPPMVCCPQLH